MTIEKIGGDRVLEPANWNKAADELNGFDAAPDTSAWGMTGVVAEVAGARTLQRVRFTFTNVQIPIAAADKNGSFAFATLGNDVYYFLAARCNLTFTPDGVGITDTKAYNIAIGDQPVTPGAGLDGNSFDILDVNGTLGTGDFTGPAAASLVGNIPGGGWLLTEGPKVAPSLYISSSNQSGTQAAAGHVTVNGTVDLVLANLGLD